MSVDRSTLETYTKPVDEFVDVFCEMQKPYSDQIMTPRQLFDWASANIPAVHFGYCSLVDYEVEEKNLEERFAKSRTIPGTRKLHSFIPISKDRITVKAFSSSTTSKEERASCEVESDDVPVESISGFVTCVVDREWWLGCVLQLSPDENQVKVALLHPPGPSNSFRYPKGEHIVTVTVKDILTVVNLGPEQDMSIRFQRKRPKQLQTNFPEYYEFKFTFRHISEY